MFEKCKKILSKTNWQDLEMIWYKLSLGDHCFNNITQNEFDPLKNMTARDLYLSELAIYQIQITYGLNDISIEGLHPFNFLNIYYLNFTM